MNKFLKILTILGIIGLVAIISYTIYFHIKKENENVFDLGNVTKEEVFSMIEKDVDKSSTIKFFMYSEEFFENDSLAPVFTEDNYKGMLECIDFFKYKDEKFQFITLRHTKDFVWGYFLEEGKKDEKTYIIIDKTSGRLKALNNNTLQLIVY